MRSCRVQVRGFSLIELLAVLAILALLQTHAVPAMSSVVDSVRVNSAAQTLVNSLRLARSEAILRNGRVVLCKSPGGTGCAASGGWEQGWIVFHDRNNNAAFDGGEALLLHEPALAPTLRLTGNAQVQSYVSYTPLGAMQTVSGAFQAGTLTICRRSGAATPGRQIVLSSSGRVRTQKTTLGNCV